MWSIVHALLVPRAGAHGLSFARLVALCEPWSGLVPGAPRLRRWSCRCPYPRGCSGRYTSKHSRLSLVPCRSAASGITGHHPSGLGFGQRRDRRTLREHPRNGAPLGVFGVSHHFLFPTNPLSITSCVSSSSSDTVPSHLVSCTFPHTHAATPITHHSPSFFQSLR